jgi:hypothetical protein
MKQLRMKQKKNEMIYTGQKTDTGNLRIGLLEFIINKSKINVLI